ncbi:MAG: hypothetical protein MUF38_11845 [Anaerolineae bacterium]|jgi:hypothetical protein|nr:hypothetical protein [Anaerolineae bacterium]
MLLPSIVFLIEQVAIGLYIFIGLGVFLGLRRYGRASGEYRATRFELERDLARFKRANAVTSMVLLIEAGLVVFGVQSVVAPTLRETLQFAPTSVEVIEDLAFNTPTPPPLAVLSIDDSNVEFGGDNPADRIQITPTPTATPVGTIQPNAPTPVGCDTANASLQIPANGQVVREIIPVVGVANVENFASFKLEIRGQSLGDNFLSMESYVQSAPDVRQLSQFNPALYPEGTYQFRLAVFDITDTLRASCTVTIYIRPPLPTPTPIGQ